MSNKYANIFHCKTLKNLPKFGFLVGKHTIWQPCCQRKAKMAKTLFLIRTTSGGFRLCSCMGSQASPVKRIALFISVAGSFTFRQNYLIT
jgi:hypothetical protein